MTTADSEADLLLQQYWRTGGDDQDAAAHLRNLVVSETLYSALTAGRCLPVITTLPTNSAWASRLDSFCAQAARLARRCRQIDQLGDMDTEPEALFEILADDVDGLSIDSFDPQSLHQARVSKPTKPAAAIALLDTLGWHNLPEQAAHELKTAAEDLLRRAEAYKAFGLLACPGGSGVALGVQVAASNAIGVVGFNDADSQMQSQAAAVLKDAYGGQGSRWGLEWEVGFGGSSIGLALWVAALVDQGRVAPDPLLAVTGRIIADGNVASVGGIAAKVTAAVQCGFRRILVPHEDEGDAVTGVDGAPDVTVIGVHNIEQVSSLLAGVSGAATIGVDGTLRFARKLLRLYGLDLTGERPLDHGYRLEVANAASRAYIDVFHGRRGIVQASGSGTALRAVNQLIAERLPRSRVQSRPSKTFLVASSARRDQLVELLERSGAQELSVTSPHEVWRYQLTEGPSKAHVIGYRTGRVIVPNGQAPAHDTATQVVRRVLGGLSGLTEAGPPNARTAEEGGLVDAASQGANADEPHIGTDEAGKGDYFGPLVCAACFVDTEVAVLLRSLGVRDSKTLSDKMVRRLAAEIRSHLPRQYAVITIPPARYNELYKAFRREGKNLNTLVAWGHARGIENLLAHGVSAEYAVIDKFADERYMRSKLLADTRRSGLRLDQRTKAESDTAVAAASILARDAFLAWLEECSARIGLPLPKGAGDQVVAAARRIVAERSPQALDELAKLHFKTTQQVLRTSDDR